MTDARLAGYWLNEMRFQELTDKQWRVFTGLLMWSVEQGTDGHVPTRYVGTVHLDGVSGDDIDALETCKVLERVETGIQMLRWDDPNGLRQSLAATVASYRDRKKANQAAYRERLKAGSVTGHASGNMTGQVGGGFESNSSSSAYVHGNVTGHANTRKRHQFGADEDDEQPPYNAPATHKDETFAVKSLTALISDCRLNMPVDELLSEAYRIGGGNPWDGYLEIKHATEQGFQGARDTTAVFKSRIAKLSPRRKIPIQNEWMYRPGTQERTA